MRLQYNNIQGKTAVNYTKHTIHVVLYTARERHS